MLPHDPEGRAGVQDPLPDVVIVNNPKTYDDDDDFMQNEDRELANYAEQTYNQQPQQPQQPYEQQYGAPQQYQQQPPQQQYQPTPGYAPPQQQYQQTPGGYGDSTAI